MKLLKVFALGGAALILSALTGCFHRAGSNNRLPSNTEEQKARIGQLLNEKYGDTFTVHTVEAERVQQAFDGMYYRATASSDRYDGTFTVRVDKNETLVDDYPRLYFGEILTSRVVDAIAVVPASYETQWEIMYPLSVNTWRKSDSVDDYIAQERVYVDITLQMEDKATDEVISTALALNQALQDKNVPFTAIWESGKAPIAFSNKKDMPTLTEQDIKDKFEREW